jgi:hypothetical protein
VYIEGMAKTFSQGTPDTYYEGPKGALWVEWKFLRQIPVRKVDISKLLSPSQLRWLERAHRNGVQCAVIVGHADGGVYFSNPLTWNGTYVYTRESFLTVSQTRKNLATIIETNVGVTDET